jgi:predicted amino acid racemase
VFLNSLVQRNPDFVRAAVRLHRAGSIPPNSYVLDLDAVRANTQLICEKAHGLGLKVFVMTKQIARNPPALRVISESGADGFVAVDTGCIVAIEQAGERIGNIGHVVQIPQREAARASAANPIFWTVYSSDKAREAAHAAAEQGRQQQLLARVWAEGDAFPPGLEGGFHVDRIDELLEEVEGMAGARLAGVTTYPAIRYNEPADRIEAAPNAGTLERAATRLAELGVDHVEVNAPGMTSYSTLELLASLGATQIEPGHGLTATTPIHARNELPERPASLYVTEISHRFGGKAYCFGGGLYACPVFSDYRRQALVGVDPERVLSRRMDVTLMPPNAIDFYAMLEDDTRRAPATGETVIFGHRIQAFVTRAFMVPVAGIQSGAPEVLGVWGADGTPVSWPNYPRDYLSGAAIANTSPRSPTA